MKSLLPSTYEPLEVTQNDLTIASLTWGATLGFGFLVCWKAIKQTSSMYKRYGLAKLNTPYVWMIWLEILVCLAFSIMCWMYLRGFIDPSFAFYFSILTLWALQVQFLLQIIINRVSVLMLGRERGKWLKIGVAVLITAVNISVYCIWLPSRLQISERYIYINHIWDRCEKVIYLVVDGCLNYYFVRVVRKNLVQPGLKKYEPLVRFNLYIIGFSLSMDILIIAMMSLRDSFVYMQFHPLAYIVKLNIEMSMAELISKIARTQNNAHGVVLASTAGDTGERSGMRSQMVRDDKRATLSKVDGTTSEATANKTYKGDFPEPLSATPEEMEMGILKDLSTRSSSYMDRRQHSFSSDESELDRESCSGNRLTIQKKQEVHMRIETAKPNPIEDQCPQSRMVAQNEDGQMSGRPTQNAIERSMGLHTEVWGSY